MVVRTIIIEEGGSLWEIEERTRKGTPLNFIAIFEPTLRKFLSRVYNEHNNYYLIVVVMFFVEPPFLTPLWSPLSFPPYSLTN